MASDPDQHGLGKVELEATFPTWAVTQGDVREGVVTDLVAVAHEQADEVGVARGLAADDEEGGWDVLAAQDRCDLRCPDGVRPVVKSESDPTARRRLAGDQETIARGQDRPAGDERRRRAERLVRLPTRADGVSSEALEQDRDEDDQQTEGEQSPVRGCPPAQKCRFPSPRYGLTIVLFA